MALNELLARNTHAAFRSWIEREKTRGVVVDRAELVRRVARHMSLDGDPVTTDAVRMALRDYMPEPPSRPSRPWRVDYLEGFCAVVGAPASRLAHIDYNGEGKVEEASYAAFYANVVGRALKPEQVKRINNNLRAELEVPGLFELISDLAEALLRCLRDGKSEAEAQVAASDFIRSSRIFSGKSAETKGASRPSKVRKLFSHR